MKKNTPSFWEHGYRRIKCPNKKCGRIIGRKDGGVMISRLTDNKIKWFSCPACGQVFWVKPPNREFDKHGVQVIRWGAYAGMTTADLTGVKIERTIPYR